MTDLDDRAAFEEKKRVQALALGRMLEIARHPVDLYPAGAGPAVANINHCVAAASNYHLECTGNPACRGHFERQCERAPMIASIPQAGDLPRGRMPRMRDKLGTIRHWTQAIIRHA